MGAIFCQVVKIKAIGQFLLAITEGNQKWRGETPNFNNNLITRIIGMRVKKFIIEPQF
jgi:hypothetical protein